MPRAKKPTKKTVDSRKTSTPVVSDNSSSPSQQKIPLSGFLAAIIVVIVILLLGYFRNQFIVATVNGEPITRIQLLLDLEKKQGKADLDNLVTEKLVMQEAAKRKIIVTDSDVNSEISKIETNLKSQGQNLDMLLAQQNLTRSDLKQQIKVQVMLKKMVKPVTVSEKEINDYLDQNKASIPQGTDPATLTKQVGQQIQQQKQGQEVQALIAELQQKAKINYLLKL